MLPQRKINRLHHYDYNKPGAYFITVCTSKRRCILAEIQTGTKDEPFRHTLLPCGEITVQVLQELPHKFPIRLYSYVIMPDHIHMLFWLTEDQPDLRAILESPLQKMGESATERSTISKMIGYLKMQVSKKTHQLYPCMQIWQRGYYDHIIRCKEDFHETAMYIRNNPQKWTYEKHIL